MDFRQYRGEHEIQFAFDADRNVTIVTGVNGAGKTGLFYALNWVLYGAEASALPGSAHQQGRSPRGSTSAGVGAAGSFCTRARNSSFAGNSFERPLVKSATAAYRFRSFPRVAESSSSGTPRRSINVILPKDARRYFFFDGERIDELTRPGHEREVQDAVRSVLKLKVLERAADHLADVRSRLLQSLEGTG